jgi:hypothetical protein
VLAPIGIAFATSLILRKGFSFTSENEDTSYTYTFFPESSAAASNALIPGPLPKKAFFSPLCAKLFFIRVSSESVLPISAALIFERVISEYLETDTARGILLVSVKKFSKGLNLDKYQFSRTKSLSTEQTSTIVIEKLDHPNTFKNKPKKLFFLGLLK